MWNLVPRGPGLVTGTYWCPNALFLPGSLKIFRPKSNGKFVFPSTSQEKSKAMLWDRPTQHQKKKLDKNCEA
jgi:hypothetical protein